MVTVSSMRPLLVPILVALIAGGLAALFVLWWRERKRPALTDEQAVRRIRTLGGPARCIETARLLHDLGKSGSTARIARAFDALEVPLMEALPDCPPDYRAELITALDLCAKTCRDDATARRIVALRNSLMS